MLNISQLTSPEDFNNRRPRLRGRHEGFTAIELLVVVCLVGVITVIAVPRITRTLALRRLDASAYLLSSKLSDARMSAIKRNRQAWVRITPSSRTFQVQTTNAAGTEINLGLAETLPAGVTFTAPSVATDIRFDSLGRLPSGTPAWALTLRGVDSTRAKSVGVSVVGKVTVANMASL